MVIGFDRSKKPNFSIKALQISEEKQAVAQYGSSDSGASLGDILGAALKEKAATAAPKADKPAKAEKAEKVEKPAKAAKAKKADKEEAPAESAESAEAPAEEAATEE
jgi:small subunit ribosomal protein S1